MKKSSLLSLLGTCLFIFYTNTLHAQTALPDCPAGTLIEPYAGICATVNDKRISVVQSQSRHSAASAATAVDVPNLQELRRQNQEKQIQQRRYPANIIEEMPPPGGIGGGTTFLSGTLQAIGHAELHTKMFVHPDGINPSSSGLSWLFTTATNRTEKGVEVVGIYFERNPDGSLGVFDWSCSPDYPCNNGVTNPAWIWTRKFTEFSCNMHDIVDDGGHIQTVMQYANKTEKLDNGSPPLWRNAVYLWNSCDLMWDLVYDHEYRVEQRDCSSGFLTCGWWGPILETFSDTLPEIDELGFEDTLLLHDGEWSSLEPDVTNFDQPSHPWKLFHATPNNGFGAGNRFNSQVSIDALANNILAEKPGPELLIGTYVNWTYRGKSNSDSTLYNVNVLKRQKLPSLGAWETVCTIGQVDPGDTFTCSESNIAIEGTYKALVTVNGMTSLGQTIEASFDAFYQGELTADPSLLLNTSANDFSTIKPGPMFTEGELINWTYSVTNQGKVPVQNVVVSGRQKLPTLGEWETLCSIGTVLSGETKSCTTIDTAVSGTYKSLNVARGKTDTGGQIEDTDIAFYQGQVDLLPNPKLELETSVNALLTVKPGPVILSGELLNWTYDVTNTGNVIQNDIAVIGRRKLPTLGDWEVLCEIESIKPGESESCTSTGTATSGVFKALIVARTLDTENSNDVFYIGQVVENP